MFDLLETFYAFAEGITI